MYKFRSNWDSIKTHKLPQWYADCKLGIFIHWGIYSVPAFAPPTCELGEIPTDENWFCNNPYAEWYYNSINVKRGATYDHHVKTYGEDFHYNDFIPMWKIPQWKPDNWAKLFKDAGAKYVILTTKHHDGFCLWPSKYTDFNSINMGPKRDIMGELTDAVRNEGLKMGAYYSGIIDWQFAYLPIYEDSDMTDFACHTNEYADYAYNQVIELIDRYKPSILWNDIGWPYKGEWDLPHLFSYYYNSVEQGLVDDRWNGTWHDFRSVEYKCGEVSREEKWEKTRGLGLSFGYNANEGIDKLLTIRELISLLVSTVANNGNLLINIGPKADGTIPVEQEERLLGLGNWLKINGEAIYDTRCSNKLSEVTNEGIDIHYTEKDNKLYVILDKLPSSNVEVCVKDIYGDISSVDPSCEAEFIQKGNDMIIKINNLNKEQSAVVFKVLIEK